MMIANRFYSNFLKDAINFIAYKSLNTPDKTIFGVISEVSNP